MEVLELCAIPLGYIVIMMICLLILFGIWEGLCWLWRKLTTNSRKVERILEELRGAEQRIIFLEDEKRWLQQRHKEDEDEIRRLREITKKSCDKKRERGY